MIRALDFSHVYEPGSDPAAPPLLLLHGTGGGERDLLPLGRSLSPGSALLSPRGRVSERGAARFFARLSEGIFDPAEVTRRTHELAEFVADAARAHSIDQGRLTAVGFSNGANIAAALLLLRPETIGAAVLIRPMIVLDQAAAAGSLAGKRILILNGSLDPLVPSDHPERLAELFRAGGAEVTVEIHPASHGLARADIEQTQAWLATLRQG